MEWFADLSMTTPAAASTVHKLIAPDPNADVNYDLSKVHGLKVYCERQGATGGTLDITLEYSPDGGTTWIGWARYAQLAAAATIIKDTLVESLPQASTLTVQPLAAGSFIGGHPGGRLRLSVVAGAGTSAGAPLVLKVSGAAKC